ncbi:MAG TPA: dihydroorotate dehydrogenase (quinone), partial [Gammaproteobacteria bacterium]|nr:dihydroorotate dehydrogenase (quinone) [Gammaproteobacteria bacterium]
MVDRKFCDGMTMHYPLIKKLLFCLDPEISHGLALNALRLAYRFHLIKQYSRTKTPIQLMGLSFENRLGLAAGLDKNGDYIDALAALGFGFIEIGTVTPRPQSGNPRPRLFRLLNEEALINRLGFNNKGLDYVVRRLQKMKFKGILGVNIGKNADTPLEKAYEDYVRGFQAVAPFAKYVTLNISSPNTENLRALQTADLLKTLLEKVKSEQQKYFELNKKYVPLIVKISPDVTPNELRLMADIFLEQKIEGVIATNTTISRENVRDISLAKETGGLSGRPLAKRSTDIIKQLSVFLQNQIPIIGCGGISSIVDAKEKLAAG